MYTKLWWEYMIEEPPEISMDRWKNNITTDVAERVRDEVHSLKQAVHHNIVFYSVFCVLISHTNINKFHITFHVCLIIL
jgi:hypothetical protein